VTTIVCGENEEAMASVTDKALEQIFMDRGDISNIRRFLTSIEKNILATQVK
jgi:hypothetical protein